MYIKKAYQQLLKEVEGLRTDLEEHIKDFVADIKSDRGIITADAAEEVLRLHAHMDTFFKERTTAFLGAMAVIIRRTLRRVQDDFDGDYEDIKHVEEALGIRGDRVVKFIDGRMTVLFGIATMKVLENDLVLMLNNSVNGEVRRRDLEKNMMRVVSRKYHDFFQTYTMAALTQSYHTAQLIYARKQGYRKFRYLGGLVQESRTFCIERAGHEFFFEQGKEWDEMWWKGKIEGVPFFIQAGGYNCGHHIEWIKDG